MNSESSAATSAGMAGAAAYAGPWGYAALAVYQIYSANQQASAMRDRANEMRAIAEMNAKYAELDAWKAVQEGHTKEARYETEIAKTIGAQKVGLASQNIDVGFGTAAEIQTETSLTGYLNKQEILNAAHAKAYGFHVQAYNYRTGGAAQVAQAQANAQATQRAGYVNALTTGVTGWSRYGGKPTPDGSAGIDYVGPKGSAYSRPIA